MVVGYPGEERHFTTEHTESTEEGRGAGEGTDVRVAWNGGFGSEKGWRRQADSATNLQNVIYAALKGFRELAARVAAVFTRVRDLPTRVAGACTRVGDLCTRVGDVWTRVAEPPTRVAGVCTPVASA
jgi:hypothetical protein